MIAEKYGSFPCAEYWYVRGFSSSHGGIDIGWETTPNVPLYAWKSGKIIWSKYTTYGGNVIVLECEYENSKQWCLYQHCKSTVPLKEVKQGDIIGTMGNTGESRGTHLHFTLVKEVPKSQKFDYNWAINHVIDPLPHLYKIPGINYFLDTTFNMIKPAPSAKETKIKIKTSVLRKRSTPSLKGIILGFASPGIYTSLEQKIQDGYIWHKIAKDIWVAQTSNVEII